MAIGCWKACCRVVRVHGWRGAHAWCVRDERALHACARVQGAGQRVRAWQWRGRGVGECRCSTCLFCALCDFFSAPAQNALQAYAKQAANVPCSEPQSRLAAAARTHRCCQLATRRRWRRAGARDCPCHLTHANTGAALFLTTTHVA